MINFFKFRTATLIGIFNVTLLFILTLGLVACSRDNPIAHFDVKDCKLVTANNYVIVRVLVFSKKTIKPNESSFGFSDHVTSIDLCKMLKEKWYYSEKEIAMISIFIKQGEEDSDKKILLNLDSFQNRTGEIIPLFQTYE